MKKIMTIFILGLFILSGIGSVATYKNQNNVSFLNKHDSNTIIFPITPPNLQTNQIINNKSKQQIKELKYYTVSYKYNSNKIGNYKNIEKQYEKIKLQENLQTFDYVIITTNTIFSAIISSSFVEWKKNVGFNVKIVNITDGEITSQTGDDLPEKIRNFLRSYYQTWGIQYVLIVGNHDTIPMRYCYPDPTNHRFDIFDWTSGEVPTDYYYADLSSSDSDSWDSDEDGYYGEYGQDLPDFLPEVYVGRIPINDLSRVTYALNKIVIFEKDTGEWKNNALHAGAFYYFTNEGNSGYPAMDGAVISYYIEQDIMDGWTINHYSEQEGLETSIYVWPALSETSFINDWRNGQYAVVNWQGHGWTNRVARKVWSWDDGDGIPEGNEISWPDFINIYSDLDDDYPSIVTAVSCYVGCPETSPEGNLGIDLLTDPSSGASIGVIASSRSPYGSFDWPNNPGGSESIIYEFNRLMINESQKVGEALYESKYYCNENYGWDHYTEYIDMFAFNLFGDPSLLIEGISYENQPPNIPTIKAPPKVQRGKFFTVEVVTTDPENDQVYYRDEFNGCTSQWYGPYPSAQKYSYVMSITGAPGTYTLGVQAKDTYDAESQWAYVQINVTKSKDISKPFFNFLQNHPNLFLLLKIIYQQFD